MFRHLLRYRFEILIRNKSIIFWSLVFPIVLSIFFKLAFSNLDSQVELKPITIGIISLKDNSESDYFNKALKEAKTSTGKSLFKIQSYDKKAAENALEENKISGYFELTASSPHLFVNQTDFEQRILKDLLKQYDDVIASINEMAAKDPTSISEATINQLIQTNNFVATESYGENSPKQSSLYFFSIIGMACMFGMNWGIKNSEDSQANQTSSGIRMVMNPVPKTKIVLSNLLVSFSIFITEILMLLAFIHYVLQVDFGNRWPQIFLTCVVGSLMSISLGTLIGGLIRSNQGLKTAVPIIFSVFGGFLSGMMSSDVKLWMNLHLPVVNLFNPANLITDSLYRLFYYTNLQTFYLNISIMLLFIVVTSVGNFFLIRSGSYANL